MLKKKSNQLCYKLLPRLITSWFAFEPRREQSSWRGPARATHPLLSRCSLPRTAGRTINELHPKYPCWIWPSSLMGTISQMLHIFHDSELQSVIQSVRSIMSQRKPDKSLRAHTGALFQLLKVCGIHWAKSKMQWHSNLQTRTLEMWPNAQIAQHAQQKVPCQSLCSTH